MANIWRINREKSQLFKAMLEECMKVLAESNARSEQLEAEREKLRAETENLLKQIGETLDGLTAASAIRPGRSH